MSLDLVEWTEGAAKAMLELVRGVRERGDGNVSGVVGECLSVFTFYSLSTVEMARGVRLIESGNTGESVRKLGKRKMDINTELVF